MAEIRSAARPSDLAFLRAKTGGAQAVTR